VRKRLLGLASACLLLAGCTSGPTQRPVANPSPSPSPARSPLAISPSSPTASSSSGSAGVGLLYLRETSLDVVWALSDDRVVRSSDAGRTWLDRSPALPTGSDWSMFALGDQDAWVAASDRMARTVNGGATWDLGPTPGGTVAPYFADALHGWILVGLGAAAGSEVAAVYRTIDGGASWTSVADTGDPSTGRPNTSGLSFSCHKGPMAFLSTSVGLIGLNCNGGTPFVYRSSDGGAHWQERPLPGGGSGFAEETLVPIDAGHCLLSGRLFSATGPSLFATQDGGASWTSHPLPRTGSIDFESSTSGWLLANPLQETADGGSTWYPGPDPPFAASDFTLQLLGKGVALAYNQEHAYRTVDGGMRWSEMTPTQE